MWQYNYAPDIYHYGVLGMKWGVHRATRKSKQNERLRRQENKYDKKAVVNTRKADKIHSKYDLGRSNRLALRADRQRKKSVSYMRKSLASTNDYNAARYAKKAAKLSYKASKNEIKGNRLARTTAYSARAQYYMVKSDRFRSRAAKARMRIANNDFYKAALKKKIDAISAEDRQNGYAFVDEYLKRYR